MCDDKILRLDCLRLASAGQTDAAEIVKAAQTLYEFISAAPAPRYLGSSGEIGPKPGGISAIV